MAEYEHTITWKMPKFDYDKKFYDSLKMKLEKGQFIVLHSNCEEFNEVLWGGVIFYMNDQFPFDEFQYLLDGGFIKAREATLGEKAMCYHTYERTNYTACSLNGIQFYLNYEASN